jgi:hypothetical protein
MNDTNDSELFARFQEACAGSDQLPGSLAAWESLPAPGRLPPPWLTWTLIALVRHRRRQLRVGEVVRDRLDGDLGRLAACGALGHPEERPQHGPVPGLPEWEYYFHGIGCCLTHRVTGEAIDVNFFGDHAEGFDFYFFIWYLRSLRDPEPPERRLLELHPSFESIRLAFDQLHRLGLLTTTPDCRAPRLSEEVIAGADLIDGFCRSWDDPTQRPWLAAQIGDWMAAEECLPDSAPASLRSLVAARAAAIRRAQADRMRRAFDRGDEPRLALLALSDLGADDLPLFLTRTLRGEISGATSSALELVEASPDAPAWCPEVFSLFRRLDPNGEAPHPWLWSRCAGFLLRHRHQTETVAAALPLVGSYMVGEIALLAMEHAPEVALKLIRRALRSGVPINRRTAAAVLALIDRPWSRAELLAVLRESDEQEATSECRAALQESREPTARRAAEEWEERNPHEPEIGRWITLGEWLLRDCPQWLRYEMDKLRERVAGLSLPDQFR